MTGDVIVDENNDNVEIKKDDKPYLALGADLSDDQKNTVLSLMGIDPANLANYNVTLRYKCTGASVSGFLCGFFRKLEASHGLLS